jgi:hypothetical protein
LSEGGLLHTGGPRPQRVLADSCRGGRAGESSDDGAVLEIDARHGVGTADDGGRRIDGREHHAAGHGVATHPQRFAAQRDGAARGDAEALEREELEVRAVLAGRLQSRLARTLSKPDGSGHLVERAALAAAHRVAGEREQVGLDVGLADAIDRILAARVGRADRGHEQGEGQQSSGESHAPIIAAKAGHEGVKTNEGHEGVKVRRRLMPRR